MTGVEALIISIVVAGLCGFAAVDRFLPGDADWKPPTRSFEELKAELGDDVNLAKLALFAVIALATLIFTLAFIAAARAAWQPPPDALFVLRPQWVVFLGPGILTAAAAACLIEGHLDRRILKDRYWDGWYVARARKYGPPPPPTRRQFLWQRRAMTIVAPLLATAGLVTACLLADSWAYVTPAEIVANPFFGFHEVHHPLSDVASIRTRTIGKHHDGLECRIRFEDGALLSTQGPPSTLSNAEVEALAGYVSERTAVPWTRDR